MKIKIAIMCSTLVFSSPLLAGNLDSPAAPTDAGSAMFTLEDIYNRLNNGTAGTKRTGAFVEPTSGPTAGTGHTLDQVMSKAPVITGNGATAAEVLDGKSYWGLTNGNWGLQQGTATAGDNVTGSSLSMTIPDGLYSGNKTATTSDADLTAANIKNGVNIFGVTGTYSDIGDNIQDTSSGDATAADIANGKKAWVDGTEVTGNVPAGNDVSGTDGQKTFTIPDGLYSGNKTATANDTDLTAANIKSSVDIFGVSGTYTGIGGNIQDTSSGDATAADIANGKMAWVDGNEVTGNVPAGANITGADGTKVITITDGLYSGSKTATTSDTDLTAANIKSNVNIFGVAGSVVEATGDATAADVLTGKTFSNAGNAGVNGSMPNNAAVTMTPSTAAQTIAAGYHNGSGTVEGDANLTAENIKKDVVVFGVTGTYNNGGVPKTGQTQCYNLSSNAAETCDASHKGQDGNSTTGTSASPRFTDNSDGTVTDNLTGLIWLKKANCIQSDYSSFDTDDTSGDGKVTWEHALDFVIGMNDGTYPNCGASKTDWRLPNIKELHSLIDFGYSSPALSNGDGTAKWTEGNSFSGVQTVNYWSSSISVGVTSDAWYVSLGYGSVNSSSKTRAGYVWPVRGGQ